MSDESKKTTSMKQTNAPDVRPNKNPANSAQKTGGNASNTARLENSRGTATRGKSVPGRTGANGSNNASTGPQMPEANEPISTTEPNGYPESAAVTPSEGPDHPSNSVGGVHADASPQNPTKANEIRGKDSSSQGNNNGLSSMGSDRDRSGMHIKETAPERLGGSGHSPGWRAPEAAGDVGNAAANMIRPVVNGAQQLNEAAKPTEDTGSSGVSNAAEGTRSGLQQSGQISATVATKTAQTGFRILKYIRKIAGKAIFYLYAYVGVLVLISVLVASICFIAYAIAYANKDKVLNGNSSASTGVLGDGDYEEQAFRYLVTSGSTIEAACGILANFKGESNFNPVRIEDDYFVGGWDAEAGYDNDPQGYADAVANGTVSREDFIYGVNSSNQPGYGLAGFTHSSIKTIFYDVANRFHGKISDMDVQMQTLIESMDALYPSLRRDLNTMSAEDAAVEFLEVYERPLYLDRARVQRRAYATELYAKYKDFDVNDRSSGSMSSGTASASVRDLKNTIQSSYIATRSSEKWSVTFINLSNGDSFNINGSKKMLAASDMKLFIMAAAYSKGRNDLDSLISPMITVSDNDSANRVVEALGNGNFSAGMKVVNDFCANNGYSGTRMGRRFLDSNSTGDNYTTANDCAKILRDIYKGTCVNKSASEKMLGYLKNQTRKNKIPAGVSGVTTANKTGELSGGGLGYAENDAAIIYGKNAYVLVVLSNDVENQGAINNVKSISSEVFKAVG